MSDFLAVAIGVLLGVLASVPVAMVIAVSTTPRSERLVRDRDAKNVVIASREIAVLDTACEEVL